MIKMAPSKFQLPLDIMLKRNRGEIRDEKNIE
jgi:hypothetical protein